MKKHMEYELRALLYLILSFVSTIKIISVTFAICSITYAVISITSWCIKEEGK